MNPTNTHSSTDNILLASTSRTAAGSSTQAAGSGQALKKVPDYLAPVSRDGLASGRSATRLANFITTPDTGRRSELYKTVSNIIHGAKIEANGIAPKSRSGDVVKDLLKLRTVLARFPETPSGCTEVYALQKQATRAARDITGSHNPNFLSRLILRKDAGHAPGYSEKVSKEILFEKIDSMHAWATPEKDSIPDVAKPRMKQRKDVDVILREAGKLAQTAHNPMEGCLAESQVVARMIAVAGDKVAPVMPKVSEWIGKNQGRAEMNMLLTACNGLIISATQTWSEEKKSAPGKHRPAVEGDMIKATEHVARKARVTALDILEMHAGKLVTNEIAELKRSLQQTYVQIRTNQAESRDFNNRLKSLIDSL